MGVPVFVNELNCQLLGVMALNPFMMHDSASRLAMFGSHISQALVVQGSTIHRTLTGVEREYGKYTHMIRMPCNATVIKVVQKFPPSVGVDNIAENPVTSIIYQDTDQRVGILDLTRHHCAHKDFGFNYVQTTACNKLVPGGRIAEGTVLAHSPSITPDGDYKFGLEAQMALMSIPQVIEDGAVVSRSFLKRLTTKGYGTRTVSWGKTHMPLNLYPESGEYRPYPDIGKRVRDDGLLFCLREYNAMTAVVDMTPDALKEPTQFDRTTYAIPNAKVVDVIILKGDRDKSNLPTGMDEQTLRYYRRSYAYHEAILNEYNNLRSRYKDKLNITPEFHIAVREAKAFVNTPITGPARGAPRITRKYRDVPIDDYMVTIVFEYDIVPTIGYKITDMHGGSNVM